MTTAPAYPYVGPPELLALVAPALAGRPLRRRAEVEAWLSGRTAAELAEPFTFVVDEAGFLRLAPRQSEHVVCAGGRPVLSAGEMSFRQGEGGGVGGWEVAGVSNQSTGYCPDPSSWPTVAAALERAGLAAPPGFRDAIVFRRCPGCAQLNVVREGWYVCVFCAADLPEEP